MMRAILLGVVLAGSAVAQEPPPGAGPRGTSGEVRDDSVGLATLLSVDPDAAPTVRVAALHRTLPTGSFVEVTALDSGRTILALVVGAYRGRGIVGLSPDAARALGISGGAAVRVRSVTPSPQDQGALRSGQAASLRLDAPPALLVALRKKVSGVPLAPAPVAPRGPKPVRPVKPIDRAEAPPPPPPPRPGPVGRFGVQVAALSSADRAAALARSLGGRVVASGQLYRVQLGPFADATAAARARDAAARQGYRDARVFPF